LRAGGLRSALSEHRHPQCRICIDARA